MAQFNNIEDLQKYLQKRLSNIDFNSTNLKDVTADTMHDVIMDNVYDAFNPSEYERRGDKGGFSDTNNMVFTDVQASDGKIRLKFENITTGNDSMYGEEISDTIENGIKNNWDNPEVEDEYGRINSDPRPYVDDTIDELRYRENELTGALKKDLRNLGFDVK